LDVGEGVVKLLAALLLILGPVPMPDCHTVNNNRVCRFDPSQQCLNWRLSDGTYSKCVKEITA
jgi:hypothetical protein